MQTGLPPIAERNIALPLGDRQNDGVLRWLYTGEKTTPAGTASNQTHRRNSKWINALEVIMRQPAEMSVVDGS